MGPRSFALTILAALLLVPGAPASESVRELTLGEFLGRPSMRALVDQLSRVPGGNALQRRGDAVISVIGGFAQPIGDLTGDGTEEVATMSLRDGGASYSTAVDLIDGASGKSLFGDPIEFQGFAFLQSARVGPDAEKGLMVTAFDFTSSGPRWVESVEVSAVTVEGDLLWSRDFLGYQQLGGWHVEVNTVHDFAFLDMAGGKQTDAAVLLTDGTRDAPHNTARVRVALFDGEDGNQVAERSYMLERLNWASLNSLPDVNEDGKDELLVGMPRTKRSPGWIEALSGLTADPMWRAEGRFIGYPFLEATADVAGNGGPEAVLQSWQPENVIVLDARSGKLFKRVRGRFAGVPGDIDGKGKSDLALQKQLSGRRSPNIVQRIWAVNGTGETIWNRTLRSRVEPVENLSAVAGAWSAGDVQDDGLRELEALHDAMVFNEAGFRRLIERHFVIDGSTGRILERGKLKLLTGSLDGRGADTVRIRSARNKLTLEARDGDTGRLLWKRTFRAKRGDPYGYSQILNRPGRSEDLLVNVLGNDGDSMVLVDGRNGKVMWRLDL